MIKEHNFRLDEIENMIPWEKTIFESLIMKYLKHKEQIKNKP